MQSKLPKLNKLYLPGLISLVGLPLLLISYVLWSGKLLKTRAMDVSWVDDDIIKHTNQLHYRGYLKKNVFDRKYADIILDADNNENNKKIEVLKERIINLKRNNDLLSFYKVRFASNMEYSAMIALLDMCNLQADADLIWFPYKNDVYIFHSRPEKGSYKQYPYPRPPCGGVLSVRRSLYPEITWKDELYKFVKDLKELWPALIFLVLMFTSHWYKTRQIIIKQQEQG